LAKFEFEGFEGPNLNQNVLKLNNVGWHNIHILPTAKMRVTPRLKLGDVVVANHTDREMRAQLGFEVLDAAARPLNRDRVQLLIDPEPAALEKLRAQRADRAALEELGHGTFRVLDPAEGIPQLDLRPGESLQFGLTCAMSGNPAGYAVRAIQYARDGAARQIIGGQTFVAGEVKGYTYRRRSRQRGSLWPWAVAAASILLLGALLVSVERSADSHRD